MTDQRRESNMNVGGNNGGSGTGVGVNRNIGYSTSNRQGTNGGPRMPSSNVRHNNMQQSRE